MWAREVLDCFKQRLTGSCDWISEDQNVSHRNVNLRGQNHDLLVMKPDYWELD